MAPAELTVPGAGEYFPEPADLAARMPAAAVAFRGYNQENLGRSYELLTHPVYGAVVEQHLREASETASDVLSRKVNLVDRVRQQRETCLNTYADAIALIVAMETAQIQLLEECFGIDYQKANLAMGYSLGEVSALVASCVVSRDGALRVLLALADDCVKLAHDVTLGVLISRGAPLPLDHVTRQCLLTNREGKGVLGVTAFLSPNSILLMGQGDTLDRFSERLSTVHGERLHLRKNQHRWPPMHTPIVWQQAVSDRCAVLMHNMEGGFAAPSPRVLSLVTGDFSYNDFNARQLLRQWTDQPQRLWDAVYRTLTGGVETILHVGPAPNIMPATYHRLAANVASQTAASFGMRVAANLIKRPWLSRMLPARSALLRAPMIQHVIVEDWLLMQKPVS